MGREGGEEEVRRSWIDISVTLHNGMVSWPGDPPVSIVPFKEIARGGSSNVSKLSMGAHTGTHMDAPRHFFTGARGLDTMPLASTIGPARVIEIRDRESIKVEELRRHRIRRGDRILFKTYGSAARWRRADFDRDYVYVTAEAARFLAERGVESRFVNGLRVTTPEVIDAVLKVFAGSVNHELVAAFVEAGARAVGLSGIDDCLAEAEQLDPELGAVGKVVRSNPALLEMLTAQGLLPVVACVAGDRQGRVYNINADQMAVACAAAFGTDRLIFLTDVEGVLDGERVLVPVLTVEESERMIRDGIATGGMQAKLNAAGSAVRGGVGEAIIASGATAGVVARLLAGEAIGSRLIRGEKS